MTVDRLRSCEWVEVLAPGAEIERDEVPLWDRVAELTDHARQGNREAQRALFVIRRSIEKAERLKARRELRGRAA